MEGTSSVLLMVKRGTVRGNLVQWEELATFLFPSGSLPGVQMAVYCVLSYFRWCESSQLSHF